MDRKNFALAAVAVFSSVMATYRYLSIFDAVDFVLIAYVALLTSSIVGLLIKK